MHSRLLSAILCAESPLKRIKSFFEIYEKELAGQISFLVQIDYVRDQADIFTNEAIIRRKDAQCNTKKRRQGLS